MLNNFMKEDILQSDGDNSQRTKLKASDNAIELTLRLIGETGVNFISNQL